MLQFIRDTHIYRQGLRKHKSSTATALYYTAVENTISHSLFLAALEPSRGPARIHAHRQPVLVQYAEYLLERGDLSRTRTRERRARTAAHHSTACALESRVGNPANPAYQEQRINGFNVGDAPCRSSEIEAEGASVKLTRPLDIQQPRVR